MDYVDREFVDETVVLDDSSFLRCKFLRCTLVYRGGARLVMQDITMDATGFAFEGPAANTLNVLRMMYHAGLTQVVDQTFEDLRRPREDLELFKYTQRKYAELLLHRGSIRIGTLYDYRKQEHGGQIGDSDEGSITFGGSLHNVDHTTIPQDSWLRQKINIGPGAKFGYMSIPEVRVESPDMWIFSTSSRFDEEALRRWNADPQAQYDCCYRIKSERLFFQAVSRAIADRAEYLGCVPVHYYPDEEVVPLDSQHGIVNPARFKAGKNYGPQSEVRAIWRPRKEGPIEPFNIEIPELAQYCDIHRIL